MTCFRTWFGMTKSEGQPFVVMLNPAHGGTSNKKAFRDPETSSGSQKRINSKPILDKSDNLFDKIYFF